MNTTQLHLQALWFDVIAPWLACKARAKYTCTKRGDKCTHAWVLDLESSNFRGYAYKISREDEHICCVLYWPQSPDWYISPWYFVTKLCSSQPHRSPSSYMVSHRGILFCLQRKEQGHCMRLYFFFKFQGIPVTSMQDTGIRRSERDNHRSGIYKTILPLMGSLWCSINFLLLYSIHWSACMGVLPAVIASINHDQIHLQKNRPTHFWWTKFPYSWEVTECFLISSWNLEIRESLQRYTTPTFTLHKRKCHETFETEKKTCMEGQRMGWTLYMWIFAFVQRRCSKGSCIPFPIPFSDIWKASVCLSQVSPKAEIFYTCSPVHASNSGQASSHQWGVNGLMANILHYLAQ